MIMGKKVDRGKEKTQSAASHDTLDDSLNRTPEPYICAGHFQVDFTELCTRNNMAVIPPVVMRSRRPSSPVFLSDNTKPGDRGKDKGKSAVPTEVEPELDIAEDGEPIELPPKTYIVRDNYEYMMPTVQVAMDNPDKADTVSEVYVRGWRVDAYMMDTFRQCFPMMEKLHTISLWNTGLTGEEITTLASMIQLCASMKNLNLDGNHVVEENFYQLIAEDSPLQQLSLRFCDITDKGAQSIGQELGSITKHNSKLITLSLANNKISDEGAKHIATGLRLNRSLLSLSLTSNIIGDTGATKFAEVLSRFPLDHKEVVERRKLKTDIGSPERSKSPTSSRRAESRDRPGSVRSASHTDKTKRDVKSSKKKPDAKGTTKDDTKGGKKKEDEKAATKKASIIVETSKTAAKTAKDTKGKKKEKGPTSPHEYEPMDLSDMAAALLEPADYIDGLVWITGNRTLINLNLSRNQIGEAGISALLRSIQYQTTLTSESKAMGTGLMRLNVTRNNLDCDHDLSRKLSEMMLSKDPHFKPPSRTPDEELQNTAP